MNAPTAHSHSRTPTTPQAMLIPLQGTMPTRRMITRRTHVGVVGFRLSEELGESPLRACRVKVRARGKKTERMEERGVARRVARRDPIVVRRVCRSVAWMGDIIVPTNTFYVPGRFNNRSEKREGKWD